MANTTFNGPVRSENGFDTIIKNASTGALTSDMKLSTYSTSITIAASGTEHKEASIGIPSNFIPMGVAITMTGATANAVNLVDIRPNLSLIHISEPTDRQKSRMPSSA